MLTEETEALAVEAEAGNIDLKDPTLYLNRELTWLEFNRRVLHEAADARNPLLERVKFLAILSSNLDEFFMKRIGGLKQQVGAGVHELSVDGRTPAEQIDACHEMVRDIKIDQRRLGSELKRLLEREGIRICGYSDLNDEQQELISRHYMENIFPLVTPMVMDPAHPFPFVSNLSLNLLVTIQRPDGKGTALARIKVPTGSMLRIEFEVDRWQQIDAGGGELRWLLPPKVVAKIKGGK